MKMMWKDCSSQIAGQVVQWEGYLISLLFHQETTKINCEKAQLMGHALKIWCSSPKNEITDGREKSCFEHVLNQIENWLTNQLPHNWIWNCLHFQWLDGIHFLWLFQVCEMILHPCCSVLGANTIKCKFGCRCRVADPNCLLKCVDLHGILWMTSEIAN